MGKCPKCKTENSPDMLKCENCGELLDTTAAPDDCAQEVKAAPKADVLELAVNVVTRYWPVLLAAALILAAHWFVLRLWWLTWEKNDSYYSHGPLVPLIAAFMIWSIRKRIAAVQIKASWLGLPIIILTIPIFLFGHWSSSGAILDATFFLFILGSMLLFVGMKATRLLLVPLLYLLFMVPLPSTILDEATSKIQLQSTTVATKMLNLSGYGVTQNGAEIRGDVLPEKLIVGAPCSGFKLLISLLTFTVFFVYMINDSGARTLRQVLSPPGLRYAMLLLMGLLGFVVGGTLGGPALRILGGAFGVFVGAALLSLTWRQCSLLLISLPLSLFINALRITMIGYAGIWTESADAMHKFHDWSGYLGLVICFAILFGFAKLIRADKFGIPDLKLDPSAAASEDVEPAHKLIGRGYRGTVAIAILALLLVSIFVIKPLDATAKGSIDRSDIPRSFGIWTGYDIPIEKRVSDMLWTADLLQRVYTNPENGRRVVVFMEAARDTTSFHDPHSCLPGSGEPITQDQVVTLRFDRPRPMTVKATMLRAFGQNGTSLIVHWYMCGPTVYTNTPAIRGAARRMQLADFLGFATHPWSSAEMRRSIDDRQFYWYRFSTEAFDEEDPTTDLEFLKGFIREFVARVENFGK